MAVAKVRNLWTAFISAFFAVLATLGLTGTATAAAGGALQQPAEQPTDRGAERVAPLAPVPAPRTDTAARAARVVAPAERGVATRAVPRDRSLPPTIKQRISAEAHGSSPAVRRMPEDPSVEDLLSAAADVEQGTKGERPAAVGGPIGDAARGAVDTRAASVALPAA